MTRDPCLQPLVQIEHIALVTGDLDRLCDFYRLLGPVVSPPVTDADTGLRRCMLDFCSVRLEVFERQDSGEVAPAGNQLQPPVLLHLGLVLGSADAVDELSRVVAAAGHRVPEPPHRVDQGGRYESVVLDPDGNRVKLTV